MRNGNCTHEEIDKIVKNYEENLNGIPKVSGFTDNNGKLWVLLGTS